MIVPIGGMCAVSMLVHGMCASASIEHGIQTETVFSHCERIAA